MVLYFSASIVFEFFCPVLSYTYERRITKVDWVELFYHVYYLRFTLDFMSCIIILYLLYRFGPKANKVRALSNINSIPEVVTS